MGVIKGKVRVLSGLRCDTIRDRVRLYVVTLVALKAVGRTIFEHTLGEVVPVGEICERCKFRTHSWRQAGSLVLARARGRGEGLVVPLVDLVVPVSRAVELSYLSELWRDGAELFMDGVSV